MTDRFIQYQPGQVQDMLTGALRPSDDPTLAAALRAGEIVHSRMTELRRAKAVDALSVACERAILMGFWSDALGSPYRYESSRDDQLNLAGAVAGNVVDGWPCYAPNSTERVNRSHTAAQLLAVLQDGAVKKKALIFACRAAVAAVTAAATNDAIDAALASGLAALESIRTGDTPNA